MEKKEDLVKEQTVPPITEEKLKELRLKLEKQRKDQTEEDLYQPSTFTDQEIKKHDFSPDFVDSQKFSCQNYKDLSKKYGDKVWLIIGKNGVIEHSDDFDSIHNTFYKKNYVGNAILTQVGKRGYSQRLSIKMSTQKLF